jgi:CheY-like chemotaxis protein
MSYKARVLCIDDEPGVIELVSLILKPQDIQVDGANSGSEGLDAMRKALPDAVLLDIMMPDMDGWEVYQQMQARKSPLLSLPRGIVRLKKS